MRTVTIGRSDLTVCNMPLGAMYLGTRQTREESFALLDYYRDRGGDFIDTANIYAHWTGSQWRGGESETVLGEWLAARGNRDDVVIASKLGFDYSGIPAGLTRRLIVDECEKSLKRMGIDTIDLYFAHVDDRETPLEETMGAFAELVAAGKVRVIGASNYLSFRLARANRVARDNGFPEFEALQQRHTYLRPKHNADFGRQVVLSDEMIDHCQSEDLSIIAYSVGLAGAYTGRADRPVPKDYDTPDSRRRLHTLGEVARQTGAHPFQVVLAWVMQTPNAMPLVAGSTVAQLSDNLDAADLTLTEGQMRLLDEAGD